MDARRYGDLFGRGHSDQGGSSQHGGGPGSAQPVSGSGIDRASVEMELSCEDTSRRKGHSGIVARQVSPEGVVHSSEAGIWDASRRLVSGSVKGNASPLYSSEANPAARAVQSG